MNHHEGKWLGPLRGKQELAEALLAEFNASYEGGFLAPWEEAPRQLKAAWVNVANRAKALLAESKTRPTKRKKS